MIKRVLIVGDICEDRYINVDCNRLAPEGPWQAVVPRSTHGNMGMAGNVASNIASLGPDIKISTLFPEKPSVKTRYVDRKTNHHFLRVDEDVSPEPLSITDFANVFDADMSAPYDAVVLSSYGKGFLNQANMEGISTMCAIRGTPVFADVKQLLGEWSRRITFVKINDLEFSAHTGNPWKECGNLIVTRGGSGMDLYEHDGSIGYHSPAIKVDVADSTGCGDVALAALVVNYLETADITLAMDFANKAGAVAVSKRGVVAVKREEVV